MKAFDGILFIQLRAFRLNYNKNNLIDKLQFLETSFFYVFIALLVFNTDEHPNGRILE